MHQPSLHQPSLHQPASVDATEPDDLLRLGLYRLPAREFPRMRALASELAAYDGGQELDEGLDIILAALSRPFHAD